MEYEYVPNGLWTAEKAESARILPPQGKTFRVLVYETPSEAVAYDDGLNAEVRRDALNSIPENRKFGIQYVFIPVRAAARTEAYTGTRTETYTELQ